ncbi:uncharacterized protein LOC134236336, partial [Saccostrea cucullata]|uniref:uncharacterized protein LOC134236336 n=1 Tax=Saccostrea cuccullata TaxID=36930 RepID=UPI002ED33912
NMPRKGKKSVKRKASEQRFRMQERRAQATEQSNISIKCPKESNTSIKCPKESNTSIKCPKESNTSIKCPKESNISIKCPEESNTSIKCPKESNTSIKCPESVTSIKCPNQTENKKSNTSIKCPNQIENDKKACETNKLKRNRQETENLNKNASTSSLKLRKFDRDENGVNSVIEENKVVVQGSFHQGDVRFGRNSGKQCVANSLSAIAHSKLKDLDEWDQTYLDNVLIEGNEIYTWIHGTNDLLLMSDLPEMIEISGKMMHIRKKDSITATIDTTGTIDFSAFDNCLPLDLAIQESLIESDGCFICAIDKTFMVMKYNQNLYLFDSHSRNKFGVVDANGKSLLMQLQDFDHLYQYCCSMVLGVKQTNQWFEVTGVSVEINQGSSAETGLHYKKAEDKVKNTPLKSFTVNFEHGNQEHNSLEISSSDIEIVQQKRNANHDQTNDPKEQSSDVEILSEDFECQIYDFNPLTARIKRELCSTLKIPSKNVSTSQSGNVCNMGPPKATKPIKGDGNCLFRALSYAISNRQEYYHKVRCAVVNHLKGSAKELETFLRPEYESMEQYVETSGMEKDGTWGTELEILAAADLLKTDIYTFLNGTWIKYSSSQICSSNEVRIESIYLKHIGDVGHYECVTFVTSGSNYNKTSALMTKRSRPEKREQKDQGNVSLQKRRRYESCMKDNDENIELSKTEKEKEKYRTCQGFRDRKANSSKHRYKTDFKYRESVKKRTANGYEKDDKYRDKLKRASRTKYKKDQPFREKVKEKAKTDIKEKYKNDDEFREKLKNASKEKYENDNDFRERVKNASKEKYETDYDFRERVKNVMKDKYENDADFRERVKKANKEKYENDNDFRESAKQQSKMKYEQDEVQRAKVKQRVTLSRNNKKEECKDIENVIEKFREEVKNGPDYVCACCLRLFFQKQVLSCTTEKYDNMLVEICISEKYLHRCKDVCTSDCAHKGTSRSELWICYTCHRKLSKGSIPAESFSNNLELEEVPRELGCMNTLEQHLVARNIPFMKILGLPKGGQKGVHGPVVCVPSDLQKVTTTLPRSEDENLLLKVKLKRKLSYKGYEEYQFVNTQHLREALLFLKRENVWYSDIQINENWLNPIPEENEPENNVDSEDESNSVEMTVSPNVSENNGNQNSNGVDCDEPESFLDKNLQGIQLDTCLQPADIGQEIMDLCFDKVFEISPSEGNNPVSILEEEGLEAKTFPVHFPTGKNTFSEERTEALTIGKYFNIRLMSVENRFAKDTSYIFFCQYLSELKRVISNVQISLRKESAFSSDGSKITGEMLCDRKILKELFKKDEAIKFLKPVRGTPPYWQAAQKDIFAMIRQLGIPQFFCSFSSADFRWTEIVQTILKQQGDTRKADDLSWDDKCKILRSNPVTAARMFDQRFHTFLKNVIMSEAEPIGKVIDYFYRVEFQQRGSPHTHCLFWIENAPKFEEDSNEKVTEFIDKYITCEIPNEHEDPELFSIVMAVQQHSKNHSKSCKKRGTACRFNFPRPPSEETFISKPEQDIEKNDEHLAKEKLSLLWDAVKTNENQNISASELLQRAGLTQNEFEKCFCYITKRNTVVLKRNCSEIFTNQYNKHLLRAWNANMDIQYILDAFSCVVYIISYISKAERELGLLLQQTKNEAVEGNLNAQDAMKKVGTAYLHHREVSAQEAVYRVTGLRLKECSRKVEFVPVGENPCRMSIPLKEVKKRQSTSKLKRTIDSGETDNDEDDSDIWLKNMVDRYEGRPDLDVFQTMCLAKFCSEFAVLAESQLPQKINESTTFKLDNNLGYIRRRTKTKPAVIRYPRFSIETAKEKYFQSILQLFLPYRNRTQLKPKKFQSYENFYEQGYVKYSKEENLSSVKQVVDNNMSEFVRDGQNLEEAERIFDAQGPQEDAWCEMCPESEANRIECIEEGKITTVEEVELSEQLVPDLNRKDKLGSKGSNLLSSVFPKNEIVPLLRTLNSKQRDVFYQVRDWCIKKKNGQNPPPFHVFVTGGAGTGKSHLIKCIYYEANRLLAHISENPDDLTVLLTAPTGTAAFNINGLTIHSALSIFKSLSLDHALLSEERINSLRSKLENLQILIIDEISMVNKRLLFFVHERLRQLKKMPENCSFGGVSIIAVGDFYQLPPVRTKHTDKLYVNDNSNPMNQLWNDLFTVVELDEIMRQREDGIFAELLNRLRVKKANETLSEVDKHTLKQCIKEGPAEALHIFATNAEINAYNNEMIFKVCAEPKLVEAEDYEKKRESGTLIKRKTHFTKTDICLPSSILLAEGARVMLIKNEDVQDGLVNGVMGTVMQIRMSSNSKLPEAIFIHFDNENVGKNADLQKMINQKRCVGLRPSSEEITIKNGVRKQYPLQLAWACTIHKVQGLTVKECVVDLKKCFAPGQAYVALSRVTSIQGLYLNEIDIERLVQKVRCDPDIEGAISAMHRFLPLPVNPEKNGQCVKLLYHNIQGLQNHMKDLKCNRDFRDADIICLTETWLDSRSDKPELEEFSASHVTRASVFDKSCALYKEIAEMQHGGVSVFYRLGVEHEEIRNVTRNLECLVFKITTIQTTVAIIYRPQRYPIEKFMENLKCLLDCLESSSERIVVMGDFNQDIMTGGKSILNYMEARGFRQCVQSSTTENGTLIDHVFVKECPHVQVLIVPTYYSYHEAVA